MSTATPANSGTWKAVTGILTTARKALKVKIHDRRKIYVQPADPQG